MNVSRRQFLRQSFVATVSGGALLLASPLLRAQTASGITHRALQSVTYNFEPVYQYVYFQIDSNGHPTVVGCSRPSRPFVRRGFNYPSTDFNWDFPLPTIRLNGTNLPLLIAKPESLTPQQLEFLQNWYADPNFLDRQVAQRGLSTTPSSVDTLVVHYRNLRHDYWESTPTGFTKIVNDSPVNDPQTLYDQLIDQLVECTDGVIDYRQHGFEVYDEESLPMTDDPNETYQDLINAHRRTINHQFLARRAVEQGASVVFVYAGNSGGMFESTVWAERESGQVITIFAMNYDLGVDFSLHSYTHYLEGLFKASPVADLYYNLVGRDFDYNVPYVSDDCRNRNTQAMNTGQVYASVGVGTVHFSPNSLYHYQDFSPLPIRLPGRPDVVDSQIWSGDQTTYLQWWLRSIPRPMLSSLSL